MTVLAAVITDASDDDTAQDIAKRRCTCFFMPCFPSETTSWCWEKALSPAARDRWWCLRWNPAREWKTLIRRFKNSNKKQCSFRYDPLSYALNFDDGNAAAEDGYGYKGFSARFASVPTTAIASVDHDAPGSREEHVPTLSKIEK